MNMIYLKSYKVFEGVAEYFDDTEYYYRSGYGRSVEYLDFKDDELDKVTSYLRNNGFAVNVNNNSYDRRYLFVTKPMINGLLSSWDINSLPDEWFQISCSFYAYRCDRIDGLLKFIKDNLL